MNTAADARALRERVLPDARLHHLPARSQNRNLRRGLWGVGVADRAAALLAEHCPPDAIELLDEMQAVAYLVGLLELDTEKGPMTPAMLDTEGFSTFVRLGVRLVQGPVFETSFGYWNTLRTGFDHYKLVRGALAVAEVEDVRRLPEDDPRRRKVLGDAHHQVLDLLATAGAPGAAMAAVLARALEEAGWAEPPEPARQPGGSGPVERLGALLGTGYALEPRDGQVPVIHDGEEHCTLHLDPLRMEIEAEIHVSGPAPEGPPPGAADRARRAMVELVGAWLTETGFELQGEGEACTTWLAARPEQEIHTWRATAIRPLRSVEEAAEVIRAHRPTAWGFMLEELEAHLG